MPGKLKILLGMYGISLLLNIGNAIASGGGWFGVILSAVVMGLLFKGSNVVRIIVMVFAVLGLIFGLIAGSVRSWRSAPVRP